ncbi:MAG: hypothetical protein ACT6Q5_08595 [Sphingopyxis solisilvae]|uniref:hypothetical protein n=1 Tax=Sphingopyxis solisilvae TaxID=1886788 RepID=UPI00403731A4
MEYSLRRLLTADGTWQKFCGEWQSQCGEIEEDFDSYAVDAMPVLQNLAETEKQPSNQRHSWAVALYDINRPLVAAMVNVAPIPGFKDPVMRIRQLTVCPLLDFGALSDETYADALIQTTWQLYKLSNDPLSSKHIHMHLRSPADNVFFSAFGKSLDGESVFDSVTHRGAWLRIDKKALTG